jgi:subtilisin family serine protease
MKRVVLVLALLGATLVPAPVTAAGPATAEPATAGAGAEYVGAVTLITGDHVSVRRVGSKLLPIVTPAPGREGMHFSTSNSGDRLLVIPSDALGPLNAGRLDVRLFDVGALLEEGYAAGQDLPLLVQGDTTALTGGSAAGATGISALKQPFDEAADAWPSLKAHRVWLDGMRQPSLDKSVLQVGAPTAWAAGYTGRGVTVAVLDTGIDATHPDFRGRIAAVRNFTDEPSLRDTHGHGTHVASTLAGAGGRYRGVAPDARLLIGKVCGSRGCPESAIIAAIDWAVRSGARIVNLSLGGPDFADVDPLELAIEQYTARHGTLFVVAAGNDGGYGQESVDSPASADAALAVGAVERSDEIAAFSGRGPRIGDGAMKPEIVAPGVEITAARSRYSSLGERGSKYTMLSGTSMATPHVAGAAAVLAQQHPSWTGPMLKAALMGSAKPLEGIGNYEQGAGRLDLARGVAQSVHTTPAAVSAGRATWPHEDDPTVTRTVTYHNPGTAAQSLSLVVEGHEGVFALSSDRVVVPAGGRASVQVTVNTAVPAPEGLLSGRIVATGQGDVRVTTPVAVDREPESYDLTLRHLDRNGVLTPYHFSFIWGVDNSRYRPLVGSGGVATLRVRKGQYHVDAVIDTLRSDGNYDSAKLVRPTVDVSADTTLTFDARQARPISITFGDRPALVPRLVAVGYGRSNESRALFSGVLGDDFARIHTAQLGDPAPDMAGDVGGLWATPDGTVTYNLGWFQLGEFTSGFSRHVVDSALARVRSTYRAQEDRKQATKVWVIRATDLDISTGFGIGFRLPTTRTEFHNVEDGAEWLSDFEQWSFVKKARRTETVLSGDVLNHTAGQTYDEDWNSAVFGAGLAGPDLAAFRSGDSIAVGIPMYSDSALDHRGLSVIESGTTTLYRDGAVVGQSPGAGNGQFDVPETHSTYRLTTEATRRSVSELSTRIAYTWTFASERPPEEPKGKGKGGEPLPLMVVRFAPPGLDDANEQRADAATVPFTVQRQSGVPSSEITRLTVDASTDDGRTWRPVQVSGDTVRVDHPRGAAYISLRAHVTDAAGNTVDQTIIRAYRI